MLTSVYISTTLEACTDFFAIIQFIIVEGRQHDTVVIKPYQRQTSGSITKITTTFTYCSRQFKIQLHILDSNETFQ